MARSRIDPKLLAVLAFLHKRRLTLEKKHLRLLYQQARMLGSSVRDLVLMIGSGTWSMQHQAKLIGPMRRLGHQYGLAVGDSVRGAALEGVSLGSEMYGLAAGVHLYKVLGIQGTPTGTHPLRPEAIQEVEQDVYDRTEGVGDNTAVGVALAALGAALLIARRRQALSVAEAAVEIGKAAEARARSESERVLVTEVTAGLGAGGSAVARHWAELPGGLGAPSQAKRVWDATLDAKVCPTCAELNGIVVDANEAFPGGYMEPPVHARCRCIVWPWFGS